MTGSLGTRLRAGRESLGLSAAETAIKLRVSLNIVEAIERDDLGRLGAPVYARGYLSSYARLVGLPIVVVNNAMQRQGDDPAPQLQSASHVSHGRFLVDRYARRAASIVLTASIVVPVIWLATEERLPVQPVTLRSLEVVPAQTGVVQSQPTAQFDAAFVGPPVELAGSPSQAGKTNPYVLEPDMAVVASFAPFMSARGQVRNEPAHGPDSGTEQVADNSGWLLRFRGDSWVEITDYEGNRLEFGVVRAGSEKRYSSARVAKVALGNASVVEVIREGQPLQLAPFQRANVARFAVSSGGELKPSGG
ncbi:MAG: helix-turn-helix domain-containing protein [Pseudomarimonas sp.]